MAGLKSWLVCFGITTALGASLAVAQDCTEKFGLSDLRRLAATSDSELQAAPVHPAIMEHFGKLARNNACQSLINSHAAMVGLPNDIVRQALIERDNGLDVNFGNNAHPKICGSIRYEVARSDSVAQLSGAPARFEAYKNALYGLLPAWSKGAEAMTQTREDEAYSGLMVVFDEEYIEAAANTRAVVGNLVQPFRPDGQDLPAPTTENLVGIAQGFQQSLVKGFRELVAKQKWTEAEVAHFVDRKRCARVLPSLMTPDVETMRSYVASFAVYEKFTTFLEQQLPR